MVLSRTLFGVLYSLIQRRNTTTKAKQLTTLMRINDIYCTAIIGTMSALYKPTVQWFRPIGLNHCTVGLDQKGKLPCTTKRSGQLKGSSCSFARRMFQLHSTLCSASCKCKVTCPLERGEGESIFFCFRKSGKRLNTSSCGPK